MAAPNPGSPGSLCSICEKKGYDSRMLIRLDDRDDLDELAECYASSGSVSIGHFLRDDDARALRDAVEQSWGWIEVFRAGEKVYQMPAKAFEELSAQQKAKLDQLVHSSAQRELQYRYRSVRAPDSAAEREESAEAVCRFAEFMCSQPVNEFLRKVTGQEEIRFADAQATAFGPGHFLTTHDDAVEGKDRLAAFVFGLTEAWQADWGGLLLFDQDSAVEGFVPQFNALRIFSVPRSHHVSLVAPWADRQRLSITGWLRSCDQPMS